MPRTGIRSSRICAALGRPAGARRPDGGQPQIASPTGRRTPHSVRLMAVELLRQAGRPPELLEPRPGRPARPRQGGGQARADELHERLDALQERLYAEGKRAVLLVLQGIDGAGKDGVIRSVFAGSTRRAAESRRSRRRRHRACPRLPLARARRHAGARRDRHLQPLALRGRRHGRACSGSRPRRSGAAAAAHPRRGSGCSTTRARGREGLPPRLEGRAARRAAGAPRRPGEALEVPRRRPRGPRACDDYMAAYEDAIAETSTEWAPWYVVPADHNWVKALAVASCSSPSSSAWIRSCRSPTRGSHPESI